MRKKRVYSTWRKGRILARGYYVRKRMPGKRRFRLQELKSKITHPFDAPATAKKLGWVCIPKRAS